MSDKIAIVGYACRLPGHVSSPEDLWELCTRKRTGWTGIPKERFSSDAFYHPNPLKPGAYSSKGGYFLQHDISKFDAPFFNLSEKEAISMDPQQRLLLECTFEALENAGIPKEGLSGRQVGVYVGGNFADYELMNMRDLETAPTYQVTGGALAMQANRLSYFFDLKGPSLTIDTACSGSLVALHHAARSLASGESTEAIVAGCKLNILPDYFVTMSMSQLLNEHGKTFAFDERADSGFAKGEGAGVLILKPLDAAIRDKDAIRAIITNTGVSQDGRTLGITNPNGDAQRDLIRKVYQDAGIDPRDCGFAEMHGTGTKVGDPLEAKAVHQAMSSLRTSKDPLFIGSVKSNVGHLEGASGIISVIKASLMLEKKFVLPNANFRTPNPSIPLADWNMQVLKSTRPWPPKKKYVSISNYGFGGTNAHAVLERAPDQKQHQSAPTTTEEDPKQKLFVFSASDREALQTRIKDLGIYFEQRPEVFEKTLCANVAYTLGCRRSHLIYRLAIVAPSLDECGRKLTQTRAAVPRSTSNAKASFVFTGQGAQWAQMGMTLFEAFPVFKRSILRADEYLRKLGATFSLLEELLVPEKLSRINSPEISQPACTAIQIGLVDAFKSWEIHPASVVGHSSGEIAAAYAVGAFDADDAMSLAYHRGLMTLKLKKLYPDLKGGMIAVGLGPAKIIPFLQMTKGYATIACVNSPSSVTVSGDKDTIEELHQLLDLEGVFNRQLLIDVAYHSEHMARVSEQYLESISSVLPASRLSGKMFSSVYGCEVGASMLGPAYWVKNLVSTVQFSDACHQLCSDSETAPGILMEIGPHSALKGPIRDIIKAHGLSADKIAYSPSLVRNINAVETVLSAAGAAFDVGLSVDMLRVNFPHTNAEACTLLTDLPRYPWQHSTSYWHRSRIPDKYKTRSGQRNDILGLLAAYSNDLEPTWRNIIRLDDIPWLRHHRMQGVPVFPLSGYLSMAVEAIRSWAASQSKAFDGFELQDVVVSSAMVLSDSADTETTITLRPHSDSSTGYSDTWKDFVICSWNSSHGWAEHCRGLIRTTDSNKGTSPVRAVNEMEAENLRQKESVIAAQATKAVSESELYRALEDVGAGYGPTFQGLTNCTMSSEYCRGEIVVRDTASIMPKTFETGLIIHPALVDTFIQIVWPLLGATTGKFDTLYMPTSVRGVSIQAGIARAPGESLAVWCTGNPDLEAPKPTEFDVHATATGATGPPAIRFSGLMMTPLKEGPDREVKGRKLCYRLVSMPYPSKDRTDSVMTVDLDPTAISAASNGVLTNGASDNHVNGVVKASRNHASEGSLTNGHTGEPDSECVVVSFGQQGSLMDRVTQLVERIGSLRTTTGALGHSNTAGKRVIILQCASKSLGDVSSDEFENLKAVLLGSERVLWVYLQDVPDAAMSVGLARTVRAENMSKISMLGLRSSELELHWALESIGKVLQELWFSERKDPVKDTEFTASHGELFVQRVVEDDKLNEFLSHEIGAPVIQKKQPYSQPGRRLKIDIGSKGALNTLRFVDDEPSALDDLSVEIEVRATGVNFKDIIVSMGQVVQPYIGVECSGIVSAVGKKVSQLQVGQRVMAMTTGAYSTYARCLETSAFPIDDTMCFEEAATIPVVFCTAYYGLFDQARLVTGESVLIHAAAGGVGQAAIMLAKTVGAEIFATVGSDEKKRFLMTNYDIPEERIFSSRDTSFGTGLRVATKGAGVDVILNSLSGEILKKSWECLAPFGRFVEIGKTDVTRNSRLDMLKFEQNCSFMSVDLTKVAAYKPKLMRRLLSDVHQLVQQGTIAPISPIKVHPISETETAFRALQGGKTFGKLVVVPRTGDVVTVSRVCSEAIAAG